RLGGWPLVRRRGHAAHRACGPAAHRRPAQDRVRPAALHLVPSRAPSGRGPHAPDRHHGSTQTMKACTLLAVTLPAAAPPTETVTLDKDQAGKAPSSWTATQTGTGHVVWVVVHDETAPSKPNVLKQSGQATYPVCLKADTSLKDGFVEVKFKAISGREDQAGGVVWRAKNANNYYIARANALENNVTIYHTVNGRRTEKKRASVKVPPYQWHTLRVDFRANRFVVSFNGQKALDWDDETFKDAGSVGVWTKADSVTEFDDFTFGTEGN